MMSSGKSEEIPDIRRTQDGGIAKNICELVYEFLGWVHTLYWSSIFWMVLTLDLSRERPPEWWNAAESDDIIDEKPFKGL